jgi:hypothetical protein
VHTLRRRLTRTLIVVAVLGATVVVGAAVAPPAASAGPCDGRVRPVTCNGGAGGGRVTGRAMLTLAGHGSAGGDNSCLVTTHTQPGTAGGSPDDWWLLDPPRPGHYEIDVDPSFNHPGYSTVWLWCIENGHSGVPLNNAWEADIKAAWFDVPPSTPQDVIRDAMAVLAVQHPSVHTSPGEGNPSLVGLSTWLVLDQDTWGHQGPITVADSTDGLVAVTVEADPDPNGQVTWSTGEGTKLCPQVPADPEQCSWPYEHSSLGQPGRDAAGLPAYAISGSMNYIGAYVVTVGGIPVGGEDGLGPIPLTSNPAFLAVLEGEAIVVGNHRN